MKSRGQTSLFGFMIESMSRLYFLTFIILLFGCTDTTFQDQPLSGYIYANVRTDQKLSFPSKIWLHRTNTLAKFRRNFGKYDGFELDIVFDANTGILNVYHPPKKSTTPTIDSFLEADLKREKYYWLDIKNMQKDNILSIVDAFLKLDQHYRFKKRVVIESSNHEVLQQISNQGFYTSLYITNSFIEQMPNHKALLDSISGRFFPGLNALSFDGQYAQLFVKNFPNSTFLCWSLNPFRNFFFREKMKNLHNSKMQIVLENEFF